MDDTSETAGDLFCMRPYYILVHPARTATEYRGTT